MEELKNMKSKTLLQLKKEQSVLFAQTLIGIITQQIMLLPGINSKKKDITIQLGKNKQYNHNLDIESCEWRITFYLRGMKVVIDNDGLFCSLNGFSYGGGAAVDNLKITEKQLMKHHKELKQRSYENEQFEKSLQRSQKMRNNMEQFNKPLQQRRRKRI